MPVVGKSHLHDMTPQERELIISLPYRVGIWMSHMDDEEGGKDDRNERQAMMSIINGIAQSIEVPAFVREIMKEVVAGKDRWQDWEQNAMDIIPDAERAADFLKQDISAKDRRNYKRLLLKIAGSVAGAHGEFGEFDKKKGMIERVRDWLSERGKKKQAIDFMNISPSEDAAIKKLMAALRLDEDK